VIQDLKPYPTYKDSGVPWLGEVPQHWEVHRGKKLFRCVDVRSDAGNEELLTVSSERGVVPRRSATVTMFKAESYAGYKLCWPGDLVINSLWAWARGLGVSRHHGIVSSAYGVYRLRPGYEVYSGFIHELVRSAPFHWELQVRSKGIWMSRLQLTDEAFLGAPFPLPPADEQSAIVRFLDHADRRIRGYIRAKQKLIKLFDEQKQAIIHRAVTRGLDPNVPIKPSGVEWLGDVPKHWEVRRLKQCAARFYAGGTPESGNESFYCEPGRGIPWLMIADMTRQRRVCNTTRGITEAGRASRNLQVLPSGTVLFSMYASLGAASVLEIDATVNQAIIGIEPRRSTLDSEYLLYFLEALRPHLVRLASASTQANLSAEKVRSLPIYLPPLEEQVELVRKLDEASASVTVAIGQAQAEISLLREFRTRLTADVITGKLDVGEAAAQLPVETKESEPDDAEPLVDAVEDGDDADLETTPEEAEV
jgi:type I restriction enzyme S subunit